MTNNRLRATVDGLDEDQSGEKLKKKKNGVRKRFRSWASSSTWNVCPGPLLEALQLCSHGLSFMHLKAKHIKSSPFCV